MSACPLPNNVVKKTKPIKKKVLPPRTPTMQCEVIPSVPAGCITCPPGPTGPAGPKGDKGDPGIGGDQKAGVEYMGQWAAGQTYTQQQDQDGDTTPVHFGSMIRHGGNTYICMEDHISEDVNQPGTDSGHDFWDNIAAYDIVAGIEWKGDWAAGDVYTQQQDAEGEEDVPVHLGSFVRYSERGWICVEDHIADPTNAPGTAGGKALWDQVEAYAGDGQPSFFDNLKNGLFDWLGDMENWGVGDWLGAIAAGAGIIWAGSKIIDAITGSGTGDGQADKRYTGTAVYAGAYTAPTLPQVVSSLCDAAGLTSYDVSLLPATETNFVIATLTSVQNILEQMSFTYQFDMVDSGGTLKFIPKFTPTVKTLTDNDIGFSAQTDIAVPYTAKRFQGIDLPQSVMVNYSSFTLDYNVYSQTATFQTFPQGQALQYDLPFTLTDAQAYALAEASLVNAHIARNVYTFTGSYNQFDLEPGDTIDTPMGTVRIIKIEEKDEGVLEFTANETLTTLNPSTIAVQAARELDNSPPVIGYSGCMYLDLPPLDPSDTEPSMHLAIHGYGAEGWPGAAVFVSKDNGATFSNFTSSTKEATIGLVAALTPGANYNVWDTTTQITVQLNSGVLESKSDLDVQNGANRCMVGQEMIHFATATLIGDKQYRLSRLLRGRQGTEWAVTTHQANELFVMIDDSLVKVSMDLSDRGNARQYKTVTIGSDVSVVTAETVAPKFTNMTCWTVAHGSAVKDTSGNWNINWIERPRYSVALMDYAEIPHDPDWAGWTVAVMNGATVVKTLVVQSPSYVYSVANQIADFGSAQTSLTVRVFAMSTRTGGGYAATINS